MCSRTRLQKTKDFLTLPLRAVTLFYDDKWGLSSIASERYEYVSKYVTGYCLDVGCGKHNRFVSQYLKGNGKGIDVYPYEGLSEENIIEDISHFPFNNEIFDTVTFIANLNHAPKSLRDIELAEAHRVLKPGGCIIITMGNPLAEILAHQVIALYDSLFGTNHDLDGERRMTEEEEYFLLDSEIIQRLNKARFTKIKKKYLGTQWNLNHLFIAWKEST